MRNFLNFSSLSSIEPGKYYWCGTHLIKEIDDAVKIYSYAYLTADDSAWYLEDTTKDGVTFERRANPSWSDSWGDYFFVDGKYYTVADGTGPTMNLGSSYDGFNWELEKTFTTYGQYPVQYQIFDENKVIGEPLRVKEYGLLGYTPAGSWNVFSSKNMKEWKLRGSMTPSGAAILAVIQYQNCTYALGKYWFYTYEMTGTDPSNYVIQTIGFHSENGYDWTKFNIWNPSGVGSGALPTDWDYFRLWTFCNYLNGVFYLTYQGVDESFNTQIGVGYSYDGINFINAGKVDAFPQNTNVLCTQTGKDRIHYGVYNYWDPYPWGYGYSNNGFIGVYGK